MTDKYTKADNGWRKFIGGKLGTDPKYPITAIWSYLTTPRWYAPRWYHEGISCFLETWLNGGVGRSLGGYDEMYFRTLVDNDKKIYSVVGIETEGTTEDFQVGANSYLYGTRFVNYLAYKYGVDKVFEYYNRTPDSKKFFAAQFKQVYGRKLKDIWKEWIEYEKTHQKENIDLIQEYPNTELENITKKPLGSVYAPIYDEKRNVIYVAANYPTKFAHISSIDLNTGKEKILSQVDGPMLYQTTYLAFDKNHNRLFFNTHNSQFRGIQMIDAISGKKLKKLKYQRVSELVYDNTNNRLYGIRSNAGVNSLVYYNEDLSDLKMLYTFKFGESVADLEVSNDGKKIITRLNKYDGNQTLISFNIQDLENAIFKYDEILSIDNVNLSHFRFSQDDSLLIGTTYYTGVSNIWTIDPKTQDLELISNVATGIFAPEQISKDSLVALHFTADGMQPVKLKMQNLKDANSINYLGQKVIERNPQLKDIYKLDEEPKIEFGDVYNNIKKYNPFKELSFVGAYPDISGYKDPKAFNHVTPVIGYRFLFQDKIGINRINFSIGTSPWSNNDWKERFHASFNWNFWNWQLNASYNNTNFYDLFGPFQTSRSGYNVGLSYSRAYTLQSPFTWHWGASINTYGMMDALPLFQNVESPVTEMQTASVNIGVSKIKSSLGAVTPESGYKVELNAYSYFAMEDGKYHAFPSVTIQADKGFLLPIGRNNSFWIRSAAGQSFADKNSAFGNDYFGGFRNNYVDYQTPSRYRTINAMPGARIDEIAAHSFAKFTGEFNFTPIRFKNFGTPGFYPTYAMFSLFSSDLLADPWGNGKFRNFVNIGLQLNVEVVLFSYLKTTWSVGYAHIFGPSNMHRGEWLFSLKLL